MELLERSSLLLEAVTPSGVLGLAVPYEPQSTNCSCGAASLLGVLRYWKVMPNASDRVLYAALGTNCKVGTASKSIVQLVRKFGLKGEISNGTSIAALRTLLRNGVAPILNFQAWPVRKSRPLGDRKDGHYAVLIAMDNSNAFFMDPAVGGGKMGWLPIAELERAWLDMETAGKVSRRAILIRGPSNMGRRRVISPVRIETGR